MHDLDETSRILETSVRLQNASDALLRWADGSALPSDAAVLEWAASFLGRVERRRATPGGRLMMQVTSARPTFYATIDKLQSNLAVKGLTNATSIRRFMGELTELLQSRASGAASNVERVTLAASFLHEFSRGLLTDLRSASMSARQHIAQ